MEPDVVYTARFVKKTSPILAQLDSLTLNSDEESQVGVFGKKRTIPRQQTAFGAPGTFYRFSGASVPARPFAEAPFLERLRDRVRAHLARQGLAEDTEDVLNFVLVNKYRDGADHIGWHSDDERDLAQEDPIASLSFGASRAFVMRLKADHGVKATFQLGDGDLLVMKPGVQSLWDHSVPKRLRVTDARYNLTFRSVSA